ncbi:uncharacterized protein [Acropora muricata]|uniref:uncharacterized protein n=1 Tax=Acropora muricata TaxID=159855 RepID=UPI0034E59BEC
MLKRESEMSFSDPSVFWTNSMSVLRYVKNESKRFHTFVANRITTIGDGSTPDQWYHVEGAMNPGDHTSRGISADSFLNCTEWLLGPEFLWKCELKGPKLTDSSLTIPSGDPEVKVHATSLATSSNPSISTLSDLFQRISSWYCLKKVVAWILRDRSHLLMASKSRAQSVQLKSPVEKASLTCVEEMERNTAERSTDSLSCRSHQLTGPSGSKHVRRSSPLFKLDPVLRNGLLCVGGRLSCARISLDAKHQIILPKNNNVSSLIINHYHTLSGHSGRQHVLSLLRQRYWVIKANSAVGKILTKCYNCRRREAPFCAQKMADLPEDRLVPDRSPFTTVGVDCFGPFHVRRARSPVKRYGVIFTCMTIRAVHIEVAHSLDTHSFLLALRRFIARRGQVQELRSDNGTNFTSGERELRESIQAWNHEKIHEEMLQRNIKWTFSPPNGSHHGGFWDRGIRSIRRILRTLLLEQITDDEGLTTLMCEVESILNSRPITVVSEDSRDLEPLTPNHLLLLKSDTMMPPGVFQKKDLLSRRGWRQIQYLSDIFWKRWAREYLPLLQSRQK